MPRPFLLRASIAVTAAAVLIGARPGELVTALAWIAVVLAVATELIGSAAFLLRRRGR